MPYAPTQIIPVLRPKLCDADALMPYLRRIDERRIYSNGGPLVKTFEERIAALFSIQPEHTIMVANGTLGLTAALLALDIPRGGLCLTPSWTFTATPAAILAAGLEPAFMDVCKTQQIITPESVKALLAHTPKAIAAVIPVSAFGAPIDVAAWDQFSNETGIPAVIDAAAAFDNVAQGVMRAGRTPVMISLHATKLFGIGEGGLILTTDSARASRIRETASFGFSNDRRSHHTATNAKPSEYSAAVGHATLDGWETLRKGWARVHDTYRRVFSENGIGQWLCAHSVTSTCNIIAPNRAVALMHTLRAQHIDTRRWWEDGCHAQPAYQPFAALDNLANTGYLASSVLGLPAAYDMPEDVIQYIGDTVATTARQGT